MLKAALNGSRAPGSHPALPLDARHLAADAAACVRAGAGALHIHPRNAEGYETLDAQVIDDTVRAVRSVTSVPIGVSTGAWIERDPARRAELVSGWTEPDMASVNLSEDGAEVVMASLEAAGVAIEAGIWDENDAERLAASAFAGRVLRVLIEIVYPVPDPISAVRKIDAALDRFKITAPRLVHGEGRAAWPVLRLALSEGRDSRIGLEDTLHLPDGGPAASNAALVSAAMTLPTDYTPGGGLGR